MGWNYGGGLGLLGSDSSDGGGGMEFERSSRSARKESEGGGRSSGAVCVLWIVQIYRQ